MIFKNSHFILVLGDFQATLLRQKGLEIESIQLLKTPLELRSLLVAPCILTILVNTSEQKVHHEYLPKLSYFDQRRFLLQLLKNRYETNNLMGYFRPEKAPSTLTVITVERTPVLENWLNILKDTKARLLGVHALPVEAIHLVDQHLQSARQTDAWVLLITSHGTNGSRHAIFYNQKLVFTRMIALKADLEDAASLAREIEANARASLAYLQRLPQAGDSPIHLICFDRIEALGHLPAAWTGVDTCALIPLPSEKISADLLHAQAFMKTASPLLRLKGTGFPYPWTFLSIPCLARYAAAILMVCSALGLSLAAYNKGTPPHEIKPSLKVAAPPQILPKQPILKDMSRLKNATYLHLTAVIYSGPQQWTVWINGKRIIPEHLDPDVMIHHVTANQIVCTWRQEEKIWKNIILKLNTRFYIGGIPAMN